MSDWLSAGRSRWLRWRLQALARSGRPIVAGPWLGEVGFELLYWIPFLQWASEVGELERVIVISRGGTAAWYRRVAHRYVDVFDFLTPEEFAAGNHERHGVVGQQKQVRGTTLEAAIVARAAAQVGVSDYHVLHPRAMFALYDPYWWGHRPIDWIERHARFRLLDSDAALIDEPPPGPYAAVKFYFNDSFPPTPENRAAAARIVRGLSEEGPVISLATGLRLDDHRGWEEEEQLTVRGIQTVLTPATNLGVQAALIARARVWAGTYGGFSYLAPFYGVPARAYYSNAAGFSPRHLELARHVFSGFGDELLCVSDVGDVGRAENRGAREGENRVGRGGGDQEHGDDLTPSPQRRTEVPRVKSAVPAAQG